MALVLLDSTVLIDALRGRPADEDPGLRAGGDIPVTSTVNVEEISRGLRATESVAAARLFDGLLVVGLGRREAELAGGWHRSSASRGTTSSRADCLVAAAAHGVSARLATGNPEDLPMTGLTVDHWPVGE